MYYDDINFYAINKDQFDTKIEIHRVMRRLSVESFLINKRAKIVNVLNRNDGLVLPSIYRYVVRLNFFLTICFIFSSIYYPMNFYFSIKLILVNCIKIYVVIIQVFIFFSFIT